MSKTPRLLLCAPASGGGKTTVTCAILQALVDRGMRPVAFKCGPDYIDPMFHSEIIGAKSRNLDLFFLGADTTCRLLAENTAGSSLAVVEGVMGYYDGIGMSSDAGAYDLARTTGTPAILVADARGRALSAAALVKGLAEFRPDSGIRGVILNRCSPMLYPRLKACVEEVGIPVFGYLPLMSECALESRHLGLITAAEVGDLREKLRRLAEQAEKTLDIDGLLALSGAAPDLTYTPEKPVKIAGAPPVVALARDNAFCFYYEDGLAELRRQGAELVEFSPMEDTALPAGACGLYLGGGYPELYARRLSENIAMRKAVRKAVLGGMPCVAECGGFLYLHQSMEGSDGESYPMANVLEARAYRTDRMGRFGYVTLTAEKDNLLCRAGETLPGHEFHYWESTEPGAGFIARKPQSDRKWDCVHTSARLYAGFPHFHFASRPEAARRFTAACVRYREELQ